MPIDDYYKSPLTSIGGSIRFPKLPKRQTTTEANDPFDPGLGEIDVASTDNNVQRPSAIAANVNGPVQPTAPVRAPVQNIAAQPNLPNAIGESVPDTSGTVSRIRGTDQFRDKGYYLPEQGRNGSLPRGVTLGTSTPGPDLRETSTTPEQNQAILFQRPFTPSPGNIAQGPNTQRVITPEAIQRLSASGVMTPESAKNYLLQNGFVEPGGNQVQATQPTARNAGTPEYSNIAATPSQQKYDVGSIGGFIGALGKEAMARNAPKLALQQQAVKKGATLEKMLNDLRADPGNTKLRDDFLAATGHTPQKDSVITIAEEPIDAARPELGMRKTPYIYTPSTKEVYRLEDLAAATNRPGGQKTITPDILGRVMKEGNFKDESAARAYLASHGYK